MESVKTQDIKIIAFGGWRLSLPPGIDHKRWGKTPLAIGGLQKGF
jgi:hypothetical protein